MRIDLEVLNSADHIRITSTSDSECVSETVRESDSELQTEWDRQTIRTIHSELQTQAPLQ